jgi:helicase
VRIRDANEYSLWTIDESSEKKLEDNGLVRNANVMPLGRAVSMSFLSSKESFILKKCIQNGGDLISIIVSLIPFENVYLTHRLKVLLKLKAERLFSGGALDVFYDPKPYIPLLPKHLWDKLLKLQMEFFACGCKDSPFCDCGMHTISKRIIELRMQGLSPSQISRHFVKTYSVMIYSGDVFSYLDEVVHKLEAVERIAHVLRREVVLQNAQVIKKRIEG